MREGFLYLEIVVVCVEFGCHIDVEHEYEKHELMGEMVRWEVEDVRQLMVMWECEFALSTLDVLQRFGFFLQMGFTLILAYPDGWDVGLLGDSLDEDD
ncbi:hypothetical protein Tco_0883400 [Tanacetum coccineum]